MSTVQWRRAVQQLGQFDEKGNGSDEGEYAAGQIMPVTCTMSGDALWSSNDSCGCAAPHFPDGAQGNIWYVVCCQKEIISRPFFFFGVRMPGYSSRHSRLFIVLATLATAAAAVPANAQFGTNLVINGDAEGSGQEPAAIPGWSRTGDATVIRYGFAGYPTQTDPGPQFRGLNFFAGHRTGNGLSSMSQTLSFGSFAGLPTLIGQGSVNFTLSGYLGGFADQGDNATFSAVFRDAGGSALTSFILGPVTNTDRNNMSGLFFRTLAGAVPINAARVDFTVTMTRVAGASNDGYADNLSFVLSSASPNVIPEPSSVVLMATGLGLLAAGARRKRAKA